jgi:hypothetical protein
MNHGIETVKENIEMTAHNTKKTRTNSFKLTVDNSERTGAMEDKTSNNMK